MLCLVDHAVDLAAHGARLGPPAAQGFKICGRRRLGGWERDEERVALRVDLHAAVRGERLPQDAAMVGGMVALLLTGVLTPAQALAGFANTGLATIAVLVSILFETWSDGKAPSYFPRTTPLKPGTVDRGAIQWAQYGGNEGLWRILRTLDRHGVPATIFCSGRAGELYYTDDHYRTFKRVIQ